MIWESHYWKTDLLKYARALQTKTKQKVWRESSSVGVEKAVFLGFYSIRKLNEAKKLSSSFDSLQIPALIYPPSNKAITLINWHKTELLFDMNRPKRTKVTLPYLANQAIHSYIFQLGLTEKGGLSYVLLASDRQRKKGLLRISIRQVIYAFRLAGKNYPWNSKYHFDTETRDYKVIQE